MNLKKCECCVSSKLGFCPFNFACKREPWERFKYSPSTFPNEKKEMFQKPLTLSPSAMGSRMENIRNV